MFVQFIQAAAQDGTIALRGVSRVGGQQIGDLLQAQAGVFVAADQAQALGTVGVVKPVAGRRTGARAQQADAVVIKQRAARQAEARGQLADGDHGVSGSFHRAVSAAATARPAATAKTPRVAAP